ncbi:MAG: asparagine--tRNA ligase [Deltaproteobacteria bacterium]|nr:MAG: asparagine--tRNA ligase [Deltaproteobacteria bacterium]
MAVITTVEQIGEFVGETVTIRGWLYNKRSSGKIRFLQIRDGTGTIQAVVVKKEVSPIAFAASDTLTQESSLEVTGTVRADSRAPGGYELMVRNIEVIQVAEDFPITPKEHGPAFLLDNRHLWLRSAKQHAILRIRSHVIQAAREYLNREGFILFDAPILTPTACEGTSTLFETDYFYGERAYLSQSGQLYAEAGAMAFGKVYTLGPTFRAEKSKTRRHLTEFWMLEPEVAYAELKDILSLAEQLVSHLVLSVLTHRTEELRVLERDESKLKSIVPPFPRITYDEALDILRQQGVSHEWGNDFGTAEDTLISQQFDCPVMITHYPLTAKAFYMKTAPDNPDVALCVDVLAPDGYGEIIGGSQREDDYQTLLKKLEAHKLPREPFEWYLDLRRYGTVPHSGFGLGIERTVAWICGIRHLREAIPFPRMLQRIYP